MMKIWLIVTIYGNVVATVGPLPYDMGECLHRSEILFSTMTAKLEKAPPMFLPSGEPFDVHNVAVNCVGRDTRPKLGDPLYG